MSDSEDEDFAFFGTPLEPLDEGEIPSKKPILIQDQIATDKHGRRRFHGAFTGGFSAGFFNTVGTLEGWKPSQFKSSRSSKAESVLQKPEDFMDDEDTDDFGIAPTLLRAKPEYSGSTGSKRKIKHSEGPIPGEPVLQSILEPARITVGMKLLMRLGWKPGQGIGPMLTWAEKMGNDTDPEELGLDPKILFPPDPVEEHFIKMKADRFGLGYVGLSKEPVLQQRFTLFDNPLKISENKKKLSIRGQAFGVGAFEEEDEDIYAKDDMSHYDFALETSASLREARRKEREKEKLAICEAFDCLEGFQPSKNTTTKKKYYPPPDLPSDFDPNLTPRRSRFDPEIQGKPDSVHGKHIINADDRAAILGEAHQKQSNLQKAVPKEVEECSEGKPQRQEESTIFRPFVSEPLKQARYEKYLGFIRIGAKDALRSIQPPEMSEWEREREASEFEQAAKLYRPLSGMMSDRFSRGGLLDDSVDPVSPAGSHDKSEPEPWVKAAKEKKFGKLTRFTLDWDPAPLLCKRMNIPEPRGSGTSMATIAETTSKRKAKFSVFDFLSTETTIEKNSEPLGSGETVEEGSTQLQDPRANSLQETVSLPAPLLDLKIIEAEDPLEKMDLFKAIFANSDEDSDNDDNISDSKSVQKEIEKPSNNINVLRNTSPPRGIFANLDLEALKPKPISQKESNGKTEENKSNSDLKTNNESENKPSSQEIDPGLLYGPSLPSKPVFISKNSPRRESNSSTTSEEEWVEKEEEKHKKKKKHTKKEKKEKKKDRHKKKKKKKR